MVKNYRKKPIVIEAIQFNGNSNKKDIEAFVGKELKTELESETAYLAGHGAPLFSLIIPTLEGDMKAMQNDWIIKGVNGEFYPCKPDIFDKTYDKDMANSLDEAKDSLIQGLKGLSAWTYLWPKEIELNEVLTKSINDIENAVGSAVDAVKSYLDLPSSLQNKENN